MKKYHADVEEWRITDNLYEWQPVLKFTDSAGYTRRHIGLPRQLTPFNENAKFPIYLNKNTGVMLEPRERQRRWFLWLVLILLSPFVFMFVNIFLGIQLPNWMNSIEFAAVFSFIYITLFIIIFIVFFLNVHKNIHKGYSNIIKDKNGENTIVVGKIIGYDVVLVDYRTSRKKKFPIYKYTFNNNEYYYRSQYAIDNRYYGYETGVILEDNVETKQLVLDYRTGSIKEIAVSLKWRFDNYALPLCIVALAIFFILWFSGIII